ncbi:MAG TPA: PAS domain S-box protein, partial [Methanoregulaceae archaeon]|nr:PAS domain S-box protein [Methanoregulaceae archaeon]
MSGSRKRREEDRSDSATGTPVSPPSGDLKAENEALKKEITALKARLSERERLETSLKESDEKFRNLLQGTHEGIILNDDEGVILEWNTGMEEIIGISRDDAIGSTIFEVASRCVPESSDAGDGEKWLSAIIDTLDMTATSSPSSPPLEIAVKHPDGTQRTIEAKNFNYTVQGRTFYGGIIWDISEPKQILESLAERDEELENLIESSGDAILLTDEEGRITKFNKAQERLTGFAAEEVLGLPAWEFQASRSAPEGHSPDPLTWYKQVWDRLLHDENDQFYREIVEDDITSTTGAVHHVQVRAFRIPTKKGFRVGAIVRDITDLKRTEVALLESEEKYRTLIEMSPDAIVIHDGGIILYANPATAHLFHAPHPENIIGRDAFTIIHPDSQAISRTVAEKDKEGISTLPTEIQVIRKDGTIMT